MFFGHSPLSISLSVPLRLLRHLSLSVAFSPSPSTKLYPEIYDSKNFLALSSARTADAADAAHRCLTGGASERQSERGREKRQYHKSRHGPKKERKGREEEKSEDSIKA